MAANFALKDLREAATKLLHRVTIEREDSDDGQGLSEASLRNLMNPALAWSHTCRSILIPYFQKAWKKVFKKNNRMAEADREKWITKLDDLIDLASEKEYPALWMSPFNGGGTELPFSYFNATDEVRTLRMNHFFSLVYADNDSLYEELKMLMEDDKHLFDFLLELDERRAVFRLKNISHAVDAKTIVPESDKSQKKLRKDLRNLLQAEKFDHQVASVSKLMMLMHILTDWNHHQEQEPISLRDRLKNQLSLYHSHSSDGANVSRTKGLLRRIEAMKWGPNNFVRDKKVIDEATVRMERFGLLTLTGVGAVGKTALASKILQVSAKEDRFDRYITMSTKVNSDQRELDPDSGDLVETSDGNSLFSTLLNSENKRISGSMNRLCRAIIRSVEVKYRYQDEPTEDLIHRAITIMKNNSMLIVIDNFEDIEAPSEHLADTNEGRKLLSDVNREYKYFQDFFTRWSVEYQGLEHNPDNPLKGISQIIITTRGKGESQQNHPMPVPPLTIQENFELFEEKIQARFRDGIVTAAVLSEIRDRRDDIIAAFAEWDSPQNPHHSVASGYVHQPAYTIFAAAGIKDVNGKQGIFEQIKKWDPQGEDAELIRKYVTSKIFGGLTTIEIGVMGALLGQGMDSTFETPDIRNAVRELDAEWDFDTANKFLREFSQHRDFFTETSENLYKWNSFYFWEVRNHFKEAYPTQYKQIRDSKDDNRYPEEGRQQPVVKREERTLLQEYLSHNNLDVPLSKGKSFNQVITELKREESLKDKDAAQSLLMLIGNDLLKAPKDAVNAIFPARSPSTNLFEKFRSASKTAPSGSGNAKQKNKIVRTSDGKFVDANFKHVWDYFCTIRDEIVEILKRCNEYTLIIRFYRILHTEAEFCRESGLISKERLLVFYRDALKHFNEVSGNENATFEKDLFDDISTIILNSYLEKLSVIPREIREDLVREEEHIQHYDAILNFVDRNVELTGTREPLLGPLFWLALRRIASEKTEDLGQDSTLVKIDEWLTHGSDCVKDVLNKNLVRQKKESVLHNFNQVIWTIDELVDPSTQRFGGLQGKLVYYRRGQKVSCEQEIHIPRGSPSDVDSYLSQEIMDRLSSKAYPYRIGVVNKSYIYLIPILIEGQPIEDQSKLLEINTCRKEIADHHNSISKKTNTLCLWSEYKDRIPYRYVFPQFEDKKIRGQIEFYKEILSDCKIPLDFREIQGKYYVKPGVISDDEAGSISTYPYEESFKQSTLIYITKNRKDGGLSLPRNTKTLVQMLEFIFQELKEQHVPLTFTELIVRLKEVEANAEIRYQLVYRLFRTLRFYDAEWQSSYIPKDRFTDIKSTWPKIQSQIWFIAKKRIEEGSAPANLTNALYEYNSVIHRLINNL